MKKFIDYLEETIYTKDDPEDILRMLPIPFVTIPGTSFSFDGIEIIKQMDKKGYDKILDAIRKYQNHCRENGIPMGSPNTIIRKSGIDKIGNLDLKPISDYLHKK